MGHLDLVRHDDGEEGQAEESLNAAQHHLETMMAYMRAWAVLTRWKQRGAAPIDYELLEPEELPACLTKRIAPFARFRQEHTRPIVIQKDTCPHAGPEFGCALFLRHVLIAHSGANLTSWTH
jgi:hypothetical protein